MGKFLAALLIFAIGISITVVFAIVIAFQVTPDWMVIIGNFLACCCWAAWSSPSACSFPA